jgi:hypothetical protein
MESKRVPSRLMLGSGIFLMVAGAAGASLAAAQPGDNVLLIWFGAMLAVVGIALASLGLFGVSSASPGHYLRWGVLGIVAGVVGGIFSMSQEGWESSDLMLWALTFLTGVWSVAIFLRRRTKESSSPGVA